jgi:hypothetical protein
MFWALGIFLLLLIALLIPILAIVLDSPVARNLFRGTDPTGLQELIDRVQSLEGEVENLGRVVEAQQEETRFVQRLLENPERRRPSSEPSESPET